MTRDAIKAALLAYFPENKGWSLGGFGYSQNPEQLHISTYAVDAPPGIGAWSIAVYATPDGRGQQGGGIAPFTVVVFRPDRPNTARKDRAHEARGDDLSDLLYAATLVLPEPLRANMSLFKPIAEAFPNWRISGPSMIDDHLMWLISHTPWYIRVIDTKNSVIVSLSYEGRADENYLSNPKDGTRSPNHHRFIWRASDKAENLSLLLDAAKAEMHYAAALPKPPENSSTDLEAQAQRVADALRGRRPLLNRVLYLLHWPYVAGPWEYHEPGEGLAKWTRMAPNGKIVAQVFIDPNRTNHKGQPILDWTVTGNHERGETHGSVFNIDDAKEAADRTLHEIGWTTS